MSAWKQRVDGEESPYTPLGPFKLRLPFYHYHACRFTIIVLNCPITCKGF